MTDIEKMVQEILEKEFPDYPPTYADFVKALVARLSEDAEPVSPDFYMQTDQYESWRERPDDCDVIEDAFGSDSPKVGDEYWCDVCWMGEQKFRVVKVADDESDDVEVELIESSRSLFAHPPLTQQEHSVPDGWVLAPKNPTDLMQAAGNKEHGAWAIYKAMLSVVSVQNSSKLGGCEK